MEEIRGMENRRMMAAEQNLENQEVKNKGTKDYQNKTGKNNWNIDMNTKIQWIHIQWIQTVALKHNGNWKNRIYKCTKPKWQTTPRTQKPWKLVNKWKSNLNNN